MPTTPAHARAQLRNHIASQALLVAPFVYDGFQARIAEAAGCGALYLSGFGVAASRGLPDLGLTTLSEMVEAVRVVTRSVGVPVICDADTGYGNPLNVQRTVTEYEQAGAAALHLEDQMWPKRCGFLEGKAVVALAAMCAKLRAAVDARRDPNLLLIARTDALQSEGWDGAEARARAYLAAGADLVFVDEIRTPQDLAEYARRLGDLPCVYNGPLPSAEVARLGFRLMLHPGTLGRLYQTLRDTCRELQEGTLAPTADDLRTFDAIVGLLGVPEQLALSERYREAEADRA